MAKETWIEPSKPRETPCSKGCLHPMCIAAQKRVDESVRLLRERDALESTCVVHATPRARCGCMGG